MIPKYPFEDKHKLNLEYPHHEADTTLYVYSGYGYHMTATFKRDSADSAEYRCYSCGNGCSLAEMRALADRLEQVNIATAKGQPLKVYPPGHHVAKGWKLKKSQQ